MTTRLKRCDGFALVELFVVLIIIAVLVAIAIPIYNNIQQTARDKTDETNVRIINSATLQWMLANHSNDPRKETTDTLKSKLAGYLMEWPISSNGRVFVLDNGFWKVQ